MDGHFRMDGVPEGDYLAAALMVGFVTPNTTANPHATDEQLKSLFASMPTVHVAAGQVASVNLILHRGAVVAGRVQYADGSPAIGVNVGWELMEIDTGIKAVRLQRQSPMQQTMEEFEVDTHRYHVSTDDEGRYRIFGLWPGKYIVGITILSEFGAGNVVMSDGSRSPSSGREQMYPEMTPVYAPGVFRRRDAKIFEIHGDEEITGVDLKIDPTGLHTVKGRVLLGEDRHVPDQAIIRVQQDGNDIGLFTNLEENGSFQINYIPPGSYTLVVLAGPDRTAPASLDDMPKILREYQAAKVPFVVGAQDVVLSDVLVVALKPGEQMDWP